MGIVRDIIGRVAKAMGAGGPLSGGWGGGGYQDAWSTRRLPTTWELLQQYKATVYSCASINAQAMASQTLRAYVTTGPSEQKTARWPTKALKSRQLAGMKRMSGSPPAVRKAARVDELTDHPILDLLARPNPHMDFFKMMELTGLYLEMTGTGYWYKERGALGEVEALWLIPPTEIYPIRDAHGYVLNYEAVRSKKSIPVEDVVFFSYPDLFAPYSKGKGPAQAGFGQIQLQDKVESYNHATMENRGRPDVFISPKEAMGPDEAARTEVRFNRKYRRAGAGGAMVLEQAVDIKPAGFSNKDLEMFQLQEGSTVNIANNFNVPISFLKTEDVNRANADAGHYQHAKLALRPRCMRVVGALNLQLAPDFDARIVLAYDDPVPMDVDVELKERESNLNNAVTTINEEREEMGLPPVEWGNAPWIPIAKAQPQDEAEAAAEKEHEIAVAAASAAPQNGGEEGDEEVKAVLDFYCSDDCKERSGPHGFKRAKLAAPALIAERAGTLAHGWDGQLKTTAKAGHKRRLPSPSRLQQTMKSIFRDQQREVLKGILGKSLARAVGKAVIPQGISLAGWNKPMATKTKPIISLFFEEGARGLNARLGLDKEFDVSNPRAAEAVRTATMKFCEETNASTSLELNDALDKLREDLAAGLLSQENTTAELTKRVSAVFDRASKSRAETIAMSESSRALHAGQAEAAKESGLQIKLHWLLSQDACPLCEEIAAASEKGVDPGQLFASVGDGPYADVPYPPAHPRCQCTMTEEVVGEKPTSSGDE